MAGKDPLTDLTRYPLLDALRDRRSRRFGAGMSMDSGPLAFQSEKEPVRLSEDEEALLAFAACGITGPALGDLNYAAGQGGSIMAGMSGRTAGSGDAIQTVAVFVINEDATYLLKRSRDFEAAELPDLVDLGRRGEFTKLYRKSRVKIRDRRSAPPLEPMFNLSVNNWMLYDPPSTYFLPVNDLTLMYINGVIEILGHEAGAFIVDERAGFRPAGLGHFAKSRGGHLNDDPKAGRVLTIQQLEGLVTEFVTLEQGMVLQNLSLMVQAMGLGGFPHWAAHPYGWLEALGFRIESMPGSRYLGMGPILRFLARLTGRDAPVSLGVGLEHQGQPLIKAFCPPWYGSMEEAVRAVVDLKFGLSGLFRGGLGLSAWRDPSRITEATQEPSAEAIAAAIAFCNYIYRRYGRFPAYPPPFRTVLGFQAGHLDVDFYDKFYRPEALSERQRQHMEDWH